MESKIERKMHIKKEKRKFTKKRIDRICIKNVKKNIGDWIFLQEKVRLKIVCQKKKIKNI